MIHGFSVFVAHITRDQIGQFLGIIFLQYQLVYQACKNKKKKLLNYCFFFPETIAAKNDDLSGLHAAN